MVNQLHDGINMVSCPLEVLDVGLFYELDCFDRKRNANLLLELWLFFRWSSLAWVNRFDIVDLPEDSGESKRASIPVRHTHYFLFWGSLLFECLVQLDSVISKDITRLLTSSQRGSVFRDVAQEKRKDASQAFRGMIWQRALASIFPSTGETRFALAVRKGFLWSFYAFSDELASLKFPGLKLLGTDMCDEKIEIARKGEYPWYSLKAEIVSCSKGFCKIGRDFYISTGSQGILNAFWYMYVQFFFLFFLIFFVGGFVLMQLSLRVKSRMSICQLSGTALGLACTLAKMFNSTSIAHHHIGCFAMSDQLCPPSHRNLNWGGILCNLVYLNPWKTGRTWTTWQLFFSNFCT